MRLTSKIIYARQPLLESGKEQAARIAEQMGAKRDCSSEQLSERDSAITEITRAGGGAGMERPLKKVRRESGVDSSAVHSCPLLHADSLTSAADALGRRTSPKPAVLAGTPSPGLAAEEQTSDGTPFFVLPYPTGNLEEEYLLTDEELGRGQFGVVRRCVHRATGQHFACKSIRKSGVQPGQQMEGLRTEIAVAGLLSGHPNIVDHHAVFEDEEDVHVVMELCRGGDLFDLLAKNKALKELEAAFILRKVVSAVAYCHSQGLIHRDIKPENILLALGASVEPKLADFGLATAILPENKAVGLAGSPFYMAPEVISGDTYGTSADVWSLGVILYIMLSGVLPFWGPSPIATFAAVLHSNLDLISSPWPSVSPLAIDLVRGMLTRDPKQRFSTADVLSHPWLTSFGCTATSFRLPRRQMAFFPPPSCQTPLSSNPPYSPASVGNFNAHQQPDGRAHLPTPSQYPHFGQVPFPVQMATQTNAHALNIPPLPLPSTPFLPTPVTAQGVPFLPAFGQLPGFLTAAAPPKTTSSQEQQAVNLTAKFNIGSEMAGASGPANFNNYLPTMPNTSQHEAPQHGMELPQFSTTPGFCLEVPPGSLPSAASKLKQLAARRLRTLLPKAQQRPPMAANLRSIQVKVIEGKASEQQQDSSTAAGPRSRLKQACASQSSFGSASSPKQRKLVTLSPKPVNQAPRFSPLLTSKGGSPEVARPVVTSGLSEGFFGAPGDAVATLGWQSHRHAQATQRANVGTGNSNPGFPPVQVSLPSVPASVPAQPVGPSIPPQLSSPSAPSGNSVLTLETLLSVGWVPDPHLPSNGPIMEWLLAHPTLSKEEAAAFTSSWMMARGALLAA